MKIYIGADHRGVELKEKIIKILNSLDHDVINCGTNDPHVSCDYPKIAYQVAAQVVKTKKSFGMLVCMSGIGHTIAANKVRGAYAALCYNAEAAQLSRQHNNANILVLGAKFIKPKDLKKIVTLWLSTSFEGGRHLRRFKQIQAIEKKEM